MFFKKREIIVQEDGRELEVSKAEIQRLSTENQALKQRNEILLQVLNLLPDTGVFLIDDIHSWSILLSNDTGKSLVQKATRVRVEDGKTSIHTFHTTPERSKWILSNMKNGDVNNNTTLKMGKVVVKSTAHKFEVNGKSYYLGIFSDATAQANELAKVDLMRTQTEQLLNIFVSYAWLAADFKIMANELESTKNGIHANKDEINTVLKRVIERFNADISMFDQVSGSNQETADIFKSLGLIALNGSIEAAHAWDAWRWFSVVADETRKIATASQEVLNGSVQFLQQGVKTAKGEIWIIWKRITSTLEDTTIEDLVNKRVSEANHVIEALAGNIAGSSEQIASFIHTFKAFYNETFSWKERIKKIILTTKLDHLLFIIRISNLVVSPWKNEKFSNHLSCDLWKYLYSPEIQEYTKWNALYGNLLHMHEMFHTIAGSLVTKLQKKEITKEEREEVNTIIKWELLSCANMVLHLLTELSESL